MFWNLKNIQSVTRDTLHQDSNPERLTPILYQRRKEKKSQETCNNLNIISLQSNLGIQKGPVPIIVTFLSLPAFSFEAIQVT
jgi:hypothetical protein